MVSSTEALKARVAAYKEAMEEAAKAVAEAVTEAVVEAVTEAVAEAAANAVVEAPPGESGRPGEPVAIEPDNDESEAMIRAHMLPLRRRLR